MDVDQIVRSTVYLLFASLLLWILGYVYSGVASYSDLVRNHNRGSKRKQSHEEQG